MNRRKLYTLLTLLILTCTGAGAQELDWLHRMSASFFSFGNATHVDPAGNYYITGFFGGSMDFGGKSLSGAGLGDIFIAKYSTSRKLQWVKIGTSEGWNGGRDIGTAPDGSVWMAGRIEGTTQFDGVSVNANGENDAVIVKYSADGNAIWARSGGGAGMDWGNSIAVDPDGNSYMVGYFNGSATFGGTTLNSNGETDLFVAAYDTDGNLRWARSAGSSGLDEGYGVALDSQGNVYVTGIVSGNADFGGTTVSGAAAGTGFLVRYDPDGGVDWAHALTGTGLSESVSINGLDEIFVAGSFSGSISPDGISLSSLGSTDVFVLKYTTSGTASNGWSYGTAGQDGLAGFGKSVEVIASRDGGFFLGSSFAGDLDLGVTTLENRGKTDIVVAQFSADGSARWGITGGGAEDDYYVSISADSSQNAYLLGNYFSPTFQMGGITLPRLASTDMVMAKIDGASATGQPVAQFSGTEVNIGNVVTGTSKNGGLKITAGSNVPLQVTNVYLEGDDPSDTVFSLLSPLPNGLPATLVGSQSLSVSIRFEPVEPGDAETRLVIETNDPSATGIKIPVTGTGLDGDLIPRAYVSTPNLQFYDVAIGDTLRQKFLVAAKTAAGLTLSGLEFEDPGSEDDGFRIVDLPSLPKDLELGTPLEVTIEFAPTETGMFEGRVVITTNDSENPYLNVELGATATEAPVAIVSASDLVFGRVKIGETGRDSLTIYSGSDGRLLIETITLTPIDGSGGFRLVRPEPTTSFPVEVQDGKPAVIAVEFAPLEEGVMTGELTIRTNDPDLREVTISLSGTGESTLSVGDRVTGSLVDALRISPNPVHSSGELLLDLRAPATLRVELIDLSGRVVADLFSGRSTGAERIGIEAEELYSGLYFCRVTIDGKETLVPVTIVR